MKTVIQRVSQASVSINDNVVAEIKTGLVILLGITESDTKQTVDKMVKKILQLRIFSDDNGLMNLSIEDIRSELLIISQFTLYGDCKKGNRPSFVKAAKPEIAQPLYDDFISKCRDANLKVATGEFGAMMNVSLVNDGPVTIILEIN
jgi:D-aminoacyl-tRNA deacylase